MELVTVGAYPTATEAAMAKNLLESEGIPAFLEDDATGDLFHLSSPFGEAKVAVAAAHAEQARVVLESAERHDLSKESAADAEAHSKDTPADEE
jgi:hypothetical protein